MGLNLMIISYPWLCHHRCDVRVTIKMDLKEHGYFCMLKSIIAKHFGLVLGVGSLSDKGRTRVGQANYNPIDKIDMNG